MSTLLQLYFGAEIMNKDNRQLNIYDGDTVELVETGGREYNPILESKIFMAHSLSYNDNMIFSTYFIISPRFTSGLQS